MVCTGSTVRRLIAGIFRIGLLDAFAYRGEIVVWFLSTTMPIVMFLLWDTAAQGQPIAGMDAAAFRGYFLAAFLVRQLAGSWVSYLINMEIKDGTLALRLLRPVHPMLHYVVEQMAHIPVRGMLAIPVVLLVFLLDPQIHSPGTLSLSLFAVSVFLGFLISFFINVLIGALAFVTDQSLKIMDLWTALFFVGSGYLVPLALFPVWAQRMLVYLPFRYQMGVPVEILTGTLRDQPAFAALGMQLAMVVILATASLAVFQRGVRRFEAYGS
jgi:ABC-2 type transport system permease protein